jgi:hypothetical protein
MADEPVQVDTGVVLLTNPNASNVGLQNSQNLMHSSPLNTPSPNKIHHNSSAPQTTPFVTPAGDISHVLLRVNNVHELVMSIREIR